MSFNIFKIPQIVPLLINNRTISNENSKLLAKEFFKDLNNNFLFL